MGERSGSEARAVIIAAILALIVGGAVVAVSRNSDDDVCQMTNVQPVGSPGMQVDIESPGGPRPVVTVATAENATYGVAFLLERREREEWVIAWNLLVNDQDFGDVLPGPEGAPVHLIALFGAAQHQFRLPRGLSAGVYRVTGASTEQSPSGDAPDAVVPAVEFDIVC